jgi:hypothetical protein
VGGLGSCQLLGFVASGVESASFVIRELSSYVFIQPTSN